MIINDITEQVDAYMKEQTTPSKNDVEDAMGEIFKSVFSSSTIQITPPPKPVEYDDTGISAKINERYPMFGFASLLDEVLEEFGGVQEIMECNWDANINEGTIACLMNDWRVFWYTVKSNEFACLSHDDRKSKINRECFIFEDMDDYGHWQELGGSQEENDKKQMDKKKQEEKLTVYGEKMSDALDDFFSGDIDALQKIMSKNSGNKASYTESEA